MLTHLELVELIYLVTELLDLINHSVIIGSLTGAPVSERVGIHTGGPYERHVVLPAHHEAEGTKEHPPDCPRAVEPDDTLL